MSLEQAKRKIQLGLLAKDMALSRGSGESAERAKLHLVERLGRLRGLPQKIGQILSLTELEEDAGLYSKLTEAPAALCFDEATELIEQRLGAPLSANFAAVSPDAVSASLSQVHRAILHDGRDVAIKLQFPGIADAVWSDLQALGWLTAPVGGLKRGFNLRAYQAEVRAILEEELNYLTEARNLVRMRRQAEGMEGIEIPEVIAHLTRENVLTMTWIEGRPFSEVLQWPVHIQRAVAETFLRLFMTSCFKWRRLHGDPHPGNFRFRMEGGRPVIGLLDFGCVKALTTETTEALEWLIRGTAEGWLDDRQEELLAQYLALGFEEELLAPMEQRLLPLTRALFEPFAEKGLFDPKAGRLGDRVAEILQDDRWNFRFAGPATLLVFLRAYQGLLQYLKALGTPVNWQAIFYEVAGDAPTPAPTSTPTLAQPTAGASAANLRIRVERDGKTVVALTFRARVAADLRDLMPDDVIEQLELRKIDLAEISNRVVRSRFAPSELFELEENGKSIRVWLE